jgi:hypothetical protein
MKIIYIGQIDYYYLHYVLHSQKAWRKNIKDFGENKILKLSNHVKNNVSKEIVDR